MAVVQEPSERAMSMFNDYMSNYYDEDDPRTRVGQLLDIIKESNDYFPHCHAILSFIYFEDLDDEKSSLIHANIARQQNPLNVLAIYNCIRLTYNSIIDGYNSTKKVVNNTSWIPYLGTAFVVGGLIGGKSQEANKISIIKNDVRLLINDALKDYFDPEDGYGQCSLIANLMLDLQTNIRNDKRLFPDLKTSLPVALAALPWDKIALSDEQKPEFAKLIRKIKAETYI